MSKVSIVNTKLDEQSIKKSTKKAIELIGGMQRIIKKGNIVIIKPNFVGPIKSAVTNFDVIRSVVEEVKKCGGIPLLGEHSGFEFDTKKVFKILSVPELAKELDVKLINFENAECRKVRVFNGLFKELIIPKAVLEADVLINIPKLKMHSLTTVTAGMKNLMGVLNKEERRKFHLKNLDLAIVDLNKVCKPNLTIVDATNVTKSAGYGKPVSVKAIVAGDDVVAVDKICCKIIGINYKKIRHINEAVKQGLCSKNIEIIGEFKETPVRLEKRILSQNVYCLFFKLMHAVDYVYSRIFPKRTLIPLFNWMVGLRPKIIKSKCTRCMKCVEVCPVWAIDNKLKINRKKCMDARCLKCVEVCPVGAIQIKRGLKE